MRTLITGEAVAGRNRGRHEIQRTCGLDRTMFRIFRARHHPGVILHRRHACGGTHGSYCSVQTGTQSRCLKGCCEGDTSCVEAHAQLNELMDHVCGRVDFIKHHHHNWQFFQRGQRDSANRQHKLLLEHTAPRRKHGTMEPLRRICRLVALRLRRLLGEGLQPVAVGNDG